MKKLSDVPPALQATLIPLSVPGPGIIVEGSNITNTPLTTSPSLELMEVVVEPPGVVAISHVAVVDTVPRITHCIHVLTSSSIGFSLKLETLKFVSHT